MDKLYIVIPAYNEEENIHKVIDEWYPIVEAHQADGESRILVIDDGSKDKTYSILCEMRKSRPLLIAISKQNEGHGATLLYGYQYAIEHGADYIFQTDSDGQTRPEEFQGFWDMRKDYDMVIGHRNKRQDGWPRILVTKTLKAIIAVCFGVKVKDANTPFRLMRADVLKEEMQYIPKGFHLSNVLIAVIYEKKNRDVLYLPITFRPRQGGVNSINMKRIWGIGIRAVKEFAALNKTLEGIDNDGERKKDLEYRDFDHSNNNICYGILENEQSADLYRKNGYQ